MPEETTSPLVNELLDAVRQEDTAASETAVSQIINAGEVETAVDQLGPLLLDQNEETAARLRVVQALTLLASPAAVPFLGQALVQDNDAAVRRLSVAALEQIDPVAGVPFFQAALDDPKTTVREAALMALGIAVQQLTAAAHREPGSDERETALNILRQISPDNLEKLLRLPILAGTRTPPIPEAAATALGLLGNEAAVAVLCRFLNERPQQPATAGLDTLDDAAAEREQETAEERIMLSAVYALREIDTPQIIPCLANTLRRNLNYRVRRLAISVLSRYDDPTAVAALFHALLNDSYPPVRKAAGQLLAKKADWRAKTRQLLEILHAGRQTRADIDSAALVAAIQPAPEEMAANPYLLPDFLIEQAAKVQDERLTALLAGLIVAAAGGSMRLAAERIETVQQNSQLPAEALRPLRVEVGGSKALNPILRQLEENLEKNFQAPIAELNQRTRLIWRQTIIIAQTGFILRALMSIILFAIGAYLVVDSYSQFTAGNLNLEQYAGPGVSFVTGLGTMLLMVFKSPLREIRRAVNDVGVATAVFIAYVHRILQISHTFSYYYLQQEINLERLKEAGDLIEDTMRDTVDILQNMGKNNGEAAPEE